MDFTITTVTLLALTVGLTDVVKKTVGVSARFIPLMALLLGVALSLTWFDISKISVLTGIFIGLSSVGLYSGIKNTVQG
jgi:hypothetical protein